ncbi:MAG: serine/threonine-protein phosphatase [Sporichthyaceae bacterium]|nr:serine/threonine-protein phosphatase [Sporichthyaceae bacterium]
MTMLDVTTALTGLRHTSPQQVVQALTDAGAPLVHDIVLYLVDYEQEILQPFVDGSSTTVLVEEPIAATLAGRAFTTGAPVVADREDASRVWVPVFEHSVRTGVLAMTVDVPSPEVLVHCSSLGMLAGLLVASASRYTDLVHVRKRGRSMTLAASMQWDMLPPLTMRADRVVVAGMLEPAYEVAGDGFDHSINGDRVDVALFDGMGHGIGSTLLTTLAMGTYRHQRRENKDLATVHETVESAVAQQFGGDAFVTGVLGRLSTTSGRFEMTNAGHPAPLLLRNRRVVGDISCEPSMPFGLGGRCEQVTTCSLEPGDTVVLYTDGVVEGRGADGSEFGLGRLVDFLEREASSDRLAEEALRRLVRTVLDHQQGTLRDDATMVIVHWDGPPPDAIPHQLQVSTAPSAGQRGSSST